MATETNDLSSDGNQSNTRDAGKSQSDSTKQSKTKDKTLTESGDPGRTPGSAEGDEKTIDEDIRQKEREGKL